MKTFIKACKQKYRYLSESLRQDLSYQIDNVYEIMKKTFDPKYTTFNIYGKEIFMNNKETDKMISVQVNGENNYIVRYYDGYKNYNIPINDESKLADIVKKAMIEAKPFPPRKQ